jgi:hypothetical protein
MQESTINLVLRLPGGSISITVKYNGRNLSIGVGYHESILQLKRKLEEKVSVPVGRQTLSYEGEILDDGTCSPSASSTVLPDSNFYSPFTRLISGRNS